LRWLPKEAEVSKKAFIYLETVAVIVAVSVPVHYFGGLDWPWAIVIGAATSVVLRWLIHGGTLARLRKRPLIGGH
jgi:hypothetical protein